MSEKSLGILAIVALLSTVMSFVVGSRQATISYAFNKGQLLIPNFDASSIHQIKVQKGDESVSMKRSGREFLVDSLRNYPAANREVNTLIRSVLGIRCGSEAATGTSSHVDLQVDGGKDTEVVSFHDAEGKELVKVLVGKSVDGGSGKYVRLGSSDTVYRSEEWISLRTRGLDYLEKELASLTRDDIAKVTVSTGGPTYVIESPETGKFELKGIPEGKKVKGTEHEGVFGAATYLNFTDFKSEVEAKDLAFEHTYVVETRNKAEYRFELAKQGDKWWARCRARYLGPQSLEVEGKSDEELQENEKLAQAAKAVEDFTARHQSWVYEISSWKAESMTKKLEDLLVDDDGKPSEVQVSHILIPYQGAERAEPTVTRSKDEAKAEAERILAEVTANPDGFADLARQHSSCSSAESGGDLGMVSKGSGMHVDFETAALDLLEVGATSQVVETPFGFHVIRRTK